LSATSGLVFNDCVTPTFSRVGSQPTKVKKTKKKEEETRLVVETEKGRSRNHLNFLDIFARYTHTKEM
jgi:hypothetical protein